MHFLSNFGCKIYFFCALTMFGIMQQDSNSLFKGSIGHVISLKSASGLLLVFFLLTGCDEYLNTGPILSFQAIPQQPVDLIKASAVSLAATQATSCTFNRTYSVHDYSGFQSRWTTISNGFFNLTMTSGNGKFNLTVRATDCQ